MTEQNINDQDYGSGMQQQKQQPYNTQEINHQHCYCGRINVNGQDHRICCMCGHRTLVNPITY